MGKKKKKNKAQDEEIDLGKLFSLIGDAFSNVFNFIGKLLKGILHYIILLLIFIKEHFIKIAIATLIGFVIGAVLDYREGYKKYSYDMIIEPNYESIHQIYEKVEYYNELIQQKDSIALHNEFNISFEEANSLIEFEIKPYQTKKDVLLAYDEFIKTTDTLTRKHFNFDEFIRSATSKYDSKYYVYRILSRINNLPALDKKIIADIERNPTLQEVKKAKLNRLKIDSTGIVKSLQNIDSLRLLYRRTMLLDAEKGVDSKSGGTYLDFSKSEEIKDNDITLFELSKEFNKKLIQGEKEKLENMHIINKLSSFNPVGVDRGVFEETYKYILGFYFGLVMLLLILLTKLNKFIKNYKLN